MDNLFVASQFEPRLADSFLCRHNEVKQHGDMLDWKHGGYVYVIFVGPPQRGLLSVIETSRDPAAARSRLYVDKIGAYRIAGGSESEMVAGVDVAVEVIYLDSLAQSGRHLAMIGLPALVEDIEVKNFVSVLPAVKSLPGIDVCQNCNSLGYCGLDGVHLPAYHCTLTDPRSPVFPDHGLQKRDRPVEFGVEIYVVVEFRLIHDGCRPRR